MEGRQALLLNKKNALRFPKAFFEPTNRLV